MAKAKQPTAAKRAISICAVVDSVGTLATRSLSGNLYLYDTNKTEGSDGFGTEQLRTRVSAGDQLLWSVLALECEAYVSIDGIDIDADVCEPERKTYPGTDVTYWIGTVKKDTAGDLPYRMSFKVGTKPEPFITPSSPSLVGARAEKAAPKTRAGAGGGNG